MKSIPFGLRDGAYYTVADLNEDEFGIDCQCVCPTCHKQLVAVKGIKSASYFRHKGMESHCHNQWEDHVLNYVWQLLEKNEELNLNQDLLKYYKISDKNKKASHKQRQNQQMKVIKVNKKIHLYL